MSLTINELKVAIYTLTITLVEWTLPSIGAYLRKIISSLESLGMKLRKMYVQKAFQVILIIRGFSVIKGHYSIRFENIT